jgi:hypothetical protein
VINVPSVFGKSMHHGRMYYCKMAGVVVEFETLHGRGQLIVKKARNVCFVTKVIV